VSDSATDDAEAEPAPPQVGGIKKKTLIIIGVVVAAMWAFAIQADSLVLMIIVGVLTALVAGVLIWAFRMLRKQRGLVGMLQGATQSPEARRDALAKLTAQKDADSPVNVFARAQLLAQDDPKAALKLLEPVGIKGYQAAMQDDVALLLTQLYLGLGRTADARKAADTMNLDNPDRKQIRPMAASLVAEAWARTGKPKEALALVDTIELPKKDREQLELQLRVVRVFAKFAANQRNLARTELQQLADIDVNYLGRFIMPQFRVHPELQKLARSVAESHPAARKMAKSQGQQKRIG
jgi:Tetratricopeptide repeat